MAATEEIEKEILAEMAANPVPYAAGQVNDVITIDGETRMISVPASEIFFGVESDKDVERKHFRCPKVVGDGIDLSKHQIYISYITSDSAGKTFSGNAGLYLCEDVATDGDDITFSWQLSGNVFASAGFIAFKVLAAKTDGENVQTRWNTVPAIGTVLMTVPDGMDIGEAYPDIVTQLLERMASVEKIATEEAMQGYVNTYLEAHPGEIDETLTDPKKAAPASVVGELKGDLVNKSEGQIKGLLVKDSYVERDGTIVEYIGWSRTNYIDVSPYSVLSLYPPIEIRFGVWLKEDKKTVIFPIITNPKGVDTLFVPLDAKYLVISAPTVNMENITISVKRRKSDNLDFNGKRININYIVNGYIVNGNLQRGDRWAATDYIEIPKNLYIESDGTEEDNAYNAFYDENKVYISSFNTKGKYINVPDNAKYMRLSTMNSNEQRVYTRNPLLLKVGSFNVGMWTDGESSNSRVDPANVKEESIKLRRFLGNTNFDFLLCEEATHEFDKDYKIDAYEYCFKNNLPFYWKTKSSTEGSLQVRLFLLTGKYELINVTYHDYECESTRGYVTFECNISGRNITFIVCHLSLESSSDGIRQQEMEELANILKKCEYGVLCGDFNAFSIDEFTTHFSEFNLANHGYYGDFNTWSVTGWESWNHCLDNIITTKSIKITNVLMGEIAMSDHKPLIAEIEIL